jgi:hypothetical protein
MNADKFRSMALDLPAAVEGSHMGHADFRVGGRIFASLGPNEDWGMVKLTAEQQKKAIAEESDVYKPAAGAWGRGGATIVTLKAAKIASVRASLELAWRNTAPKKLFEEEAPDEAQGTARTSASRGRGKGKGSSNSSPRKREPR